MFQAIDTTDFVQGSRFSTAAQAVTFLKAGNATVTLVSKKTRQRFTYRVRKAKDAQDLFFVGVLTGSNNENDFSYLGTLRGTTYALGRKSRISAEAPSHKAFAWAIGNLLNGNLPDVLEIWHEGRCGRCHRKLTVPSSIESGLGPECAGRV
jgi:hypothetical protein